MRNLRLFVVALLFVGAFGCGDGDGGGASAGVNVSGTWAGQLTASQGGASATAAGGATVVQSGNTFSYTVSAAGETLSGGGIVQGNVLNFQDGTLTATVSGDTMVISGTDSDGITWSGTLTRQ